MELVDTSEGQAQGLNCLGREVGACWAGLGRADI